MVKDITCGGCRFLKWNRDQYNLSFVNSIWNNKIVCDKSGLTIADSCERSDKCMNENWKEVID